MNTTVNDITNTFYFLSIQKGFGELKKICQGKLKLIHSFLHSFLSTKITLSFLELCSNLESFLSINIWIALFFLLKGMIVYESLLKECEK